MAFLAISPVETANCYFIYLVMWVENPLYLYFSVLFFKKKLIQEHTDNCFLSLRVNYRFLWLLIHPIYEISHQALIHITSGHYYYLVTDVVQKCHFSILLEVFSTEASSCLWSH